MSAAGSTEDESQGHVLLMANRPISLVGCLPHQSGAGRTGLLVVGGAPYWKMRATWSSGWKPLLLQ